MRFLLSAFLLVSSLSACNGQETYSWNQRMTVTIETPDGPVTGSSVIEVRVAYSESGMGLARDVQFQARHSGEAVAVEVAPEQYLFVPLRAPSSWLYAADPDRFGNVGFPDYLRDVRDQTEPFVLCNDGQYCPEMLALVERDLYGLRVLAPETVTDAFGPGFAITDVTLEVTRDPVAWGGMHQALGWTCTDFPGARPGWRPSLRVTGTGPLGWDVVGYQDFSTDNFCNLGDEQ